MDVWISIRGRQLMTGGTEEDTLEMMTEGLLTRSPDGLKLSYREKNEDGFGQTETILTLENAPGRVTLLRVGEVTTQMVFEKGQRNASYYETQMGAMLVGIHTRDLQCREVKNTGGLDIEMEYALEIDNAVIGTNMLRIEVREATGLTSNDYPLSTLHNDRFLH